MATYTENLNLKKPAISDPASIGDTNSNMDIIDNTLTSAIMFENITFDAGNFTAEQYRNDIDYTLTPKTGYTPILVNVTTSSHTRILIVNYGITDGVINVRARNLSTSAQTTVRFIAKVLWVKNELA